MLTKFKLHTHLLLRVANLCLGQGDNTDNGLKGSQSEAIKSHSYKIENKLITILQNSLKLNLNVTNTLKGNF